MRALVDADMTCHEIGHIMEDTGKSDAEGNPIKRLLSIPETLRLAVGRIMSIVIHSEAGGYDLFLTGKGNFRDKLATIRGYKANRIGKPRDNVDVIKDHLIKVFNAKLCKGYEADDAMAMEQWGDLQEVAIENDMGNDPTGWDWEALKYMANTVIASRDKDLCTVPGWHYKWYVKLARKQNGEPLDPDEIIIDKGEVFWVTWLEALRNFYKQMLLGDASDNIAGLYKVGEKSAWVKQLDDMTDEQEMYEHVQDKYEKHYNGHWRMFLIETARLLHMWRRPDDQWEIPDERDEDYWK